MRCTPVLLLTASLVACQTGATQVVVTLATDAPLDRSMVIRAIVRSGNRIVGDAGVTSWTRGENIDGGITLPGTFTVVPAPGEPRDQLVTLVLEASLAIGAQGEPAREFRRIVRFTFTPRTTTALPIYLSVACANPAIGCSAGPAADCTLSQLCEERGQTCGDLGECVDQAVTPLPSDAGILAIDVPARDVTTPARDVLDVQRDVIDAQPDATDAQRDIVDIVDAGSDAGPCGDAGCPQATALGLGSAHTCVRLADGTARCWGGNSYGQLGDDSTMARRHSVAVVGLTNVSEIGGGTEHSCARLATGVVLCWGLNAQGELGIGDTMFHRGVPDPALAAINSGAMQLAVQTNSSCAVLSGGMVVCWGFNNVGQLGDGTMMNRALPTPVSGITAGVQVAVGDAHGCALLVDGTLRCWGSNGFGQLGNGTTAPSAMPVAVNLATTARSVAIGYEHTCAVTTGNALYCWGHNDYGQLGVPGMLVRMDPTLVRSDIRQVATGSGHTCATTMAGVVLCWGLSNYGQVGDGTMASRDVPTIVPGLDGSSRVAVGRHHSCAILADASVRCWGLNSAGQIGDDTNINRVSPTPVSLVP